MALPGGDDFSDVTQVFANAALGKLPAFSECKLDFTTTIEMANDELIMARGFTLNEAMSAIEVCP